MSRRKIGWDLSADDCVIHALVVAVALKAAGREVSAEAVLLALSETEPSGWILGMLSSRRGEWVGEFEDWLGRSEEIVTSLSALGSRPKA